MHLNKTFTYIKALVSCCGVMQCFHTDVGNVSTTNALNFKGLVRLQNKKNKNGEESCGFNHIQTWEGSFKPRSTTAIFWCKLLLIVMELKDQSSWLFYFEGILQAGPMTKLGAYQNLFYLSYPVPLVENESPLTSGLLLKSTYFVSCPTITNINPYK